MKQQMASGKLAHMKSGNGKTSYANNSLLQRKVMLKAKPMLEETIREMFNAMDMKTSANCITIAEFGCSSGPNCLLLVSEILDAIDHDVPSQILKLPLEFQVFLNDLPGNDFNTLFSKYLLPFRQNLEKKSIRPCFISGVPGSFYGRLFPVKSLHFAHSSYSLHWLSKVPEGLVNKGNIYISKLSPPRVFEAYHEQFTRDFTVFLRSRSEEMKPGGRMFLIFLGRSGKDPTTNYCYTLDLITKSLFDLVPQGKVTEEEVDSFHVPIYAPFKEEIRSVVEEEGSFKMIKLETFEANWDPDDDDENFVIDNYASGIRVSNYLRAVFEPLLATHFGDNIMDELFQRLAVNVADHLGIEKTKYTNIVITMTNMSNRNVNSSTQRI